MSGLQDMVQKDMYREYLRRLDARAVLEHYGVERASEQTNASDGTTEIVHSCLLDRVEPHHSNGDAHPSASCNIDKNFYVCYALGWGGDLLHFIKKMEGLETFADTLSPASEFLTSSTLEAVDWRAELEKAFDTSGGYTINLPSYDERILDSWDAPHVYWNHRGISKQAQQALRLGYDERERRIVFPHFVDHKLVGWQKRVIPGETIPDYPKYKNSPGFPKTETLYNFDRVAGYYNVIVVESPMSVARALSYDIPNVVATFGAKVSGAQIAMLRRFSTAFVWFDRDGAGLAGEKKLVEGLYRHTQVRVVTPDGGKDMGDATEEEIFIKLTEAIPAALRLGEYDGRIRR